MKILITADLHYNIARSRGPAEALASQALQAGGDVLVLVGDTAGADLTPLRQCLGLFAGFRGLKLLVPGNHCLWCRGEETSMERYERIVPEAAAQEGFVVLDHNPQALGRAGLVGSVGWYDYSFADAGLGLPEDFYRAKVSPGAAAYLGGHEQLLERHEATLTQQHYSMGVRWMDGVHVKLGMSDEEFVALLAKKLRSQIDELAPRVDRVLAFVHHLPFRDLVPKGRPARFAFAAAYMGADLLGQVLMENPKVSHVYCGHSHWEHRQRMGNVIVTNIGSTYVEKRLETLEI